MLTPQRRAMIDVGTNSVKLLVADVAGTDLVPVLEDSKQTRLGAGFYETLILQPEPLAKTIKAVARFAEVARDLGAVKLRVIATSAARDARNSYEIQIAIRQATGVDMEIISGDQEAEWAYQGVITDPALARLPLMIVDLGGGSSEFIVAQPGQVIFRKSFKLGTVRLFEKYHPGDPPAADLLEHVRAEVTAFFDNEIVPAVQPMLAKAAADTQPTLVGTGGTTTILARLKLKVDSFERSQLEGTIVTREEISAEVNRQWTMPLQARKALPGMPPKRADIFIFGAIIYQILMSKFPFPTVRVSTRGLRFAALLEG